MEYVNIFFTLVYINNTQVNLKKNNKNSLVISNKKFNHFLNINQIFSILHNIYLY